MVAFEPYTIQCMTCNAQLRVEREEAIGKILACPKCQSMVQIGDTRTPVDPIPVHEQAEPDRYRSLNEQASSILTSSDSTDKTTSSDELNIRAPSVPKIKLPQWLVLPVAAFAGIVFTTGLWFAVRQVPDQNYTEMPSTPNVAPHMMPVQPDDESDQTNTPATAVRAVPPLSPLNSLPATITELDQMNKAISTPHEVVPPNTELSLEDRKINEQKKIRHGSTLAENQDSPAELSPQELPLASNSRLPLPPPNELLQKKLDLPLLEIRFTDMSLQSAVAILADLSNTKIVIDQASLIRIGISPEMHVQLNSESSSVRDNLYKLLQPLGLTAIPSDNFIFISAPEITDQRLSEQCYSLEAQDAETMERIICEVIVPLTNQRADLPTTVNRKGNQLCIVQTDAGHGATHRLLTLLENLRRGSIADTTVNNPTREESPLNKIVNWDARQALPLDAFLQRLASRLGSRIVLDELSLLRSGISSTQPIEVKAGQQTLAEFIDQSLGPLGLDAQVMDDRSVIIASDKAHEWAPLLRVYPIPPTIDVDLETLIRMITERIAPDSWVSGGGDGQILVEGRTAALIVMQQPDVQRAISNFLADFASD